METEIILNEIRKYATNNELLIKINEDEDFRKSYEFCLSFEEFEDFETVETTFNINTLNNVLRECLNNGFFVSFETNN